MKTVTLKEFLLRVIRLKEDNTNIISNLRIKNDITSKELDVVEQKLAKSNNCESLLIGWLGAITLKGLTITNCEFDFVESEGLFFDGCNLELVRFKNCCLATLKFCECNIKSIRIDKINSDNLVFDSCAIFSCALYNSYLHSYYLYSNCIHEKFSNEYLFCYSLTVSDNNKLVDTNPVFEMYKSLIQLLDNNYIESENRNKGKAVESLNIRFSCSDIIADAGSNARAQLVNGVQLKEDLIGYKKIRCVKPDKDWNKYKSGATVIAVIRIPKGAVVFGNGYSKCRTNKAEVIKIEGYNENYKYYSLYDDNFKYEIGKQMEIDDFNYNHTKECASGIHFFLTKEEARNYCF